ncbi:MAG TPA: hypothetical protein VMI31_07310, partial [Fimbriimonadaceae bacterium]|nr:hypothetical protein [Fimbriimonadaceae bacterium]
MKQFAWSLSEPCPGQWAALGLVCAWIVGGCTAKLPASIPVAHKAAPADPWTMTCLDPTDPEPALLWNGQIGIRIGRDGTGSGPMFLIDEYDTTGEEKIRELKDPLQGAWVAGTDDIRLSPAGSADYRQQLDMSTGLLTTRWSQTVGGARAGVECVTAVNAHRREVAQRWVISSDSYIPVKYGGGGRVPLNRGDGLGPDHIEWILPPSGTVITERDEVGPDNRHLDFTDKVISDWSPGAVDNAADKGHPLTFARILDIAPSPNGATVRAERQALRASPTGSGASSAGQSASKLAHSKEAPPSFD